jgi:uncharacterized membrane protein
MKKRHIYSGLTLALSLIGIIDGVYIFFLSAYSKFSQLSLYLTISAIVFSILPFVYVALTSIILYKESRPSVLRIFLIGNCLLGLYVGILFLNILSIHTLIEMISAFMIVIVSSLFIFNLKRLKIK